MKDDPNAPVTNRQMEEAVDAILAGMQRMFDKQDEKIEESKKELKGEMDSFRRETKKGFSEVKKRLEDTSSRKEFNDLKEKVYRHHPSS